MNNIYWWFILFYSIFYSIFMTCSEKGMEANIFVIFLFAKQHCIIVFRWARWSLQVGNYVHNDKNNCKGHLGDGRSAIKNLKFTPKKSCDPTDMVSLKRNQRVSNNNSLYIMTSFSYLSLLGGGSVNQQKESLTLYVIYLLWHFNDRKAVTV